MPTENRSSNTDPRDVFIRLNPLGLGESELRKDSTGFEDQRTHSDYLLFLAGYRETHPEPQHHTDPGGVERLIAQCVEKDALIAEIDRIGSAKLAERDALIEQMLERLNKAQIFGWDKKVAALSASADPSAPGVLPRAHDVNMFQRTAQPGAKS
ncbi:hypothetical protein ACF8FB_03135 [Pseudomonas sp. yb_2]|uniref:hypothetical protein n=1 Tax=Pseudomonas sp. yb_2 TaxID=3367218 RepID=UPI00370B3CD5